MEISTYTTTSTLTLPHLLLYFLRATNGCKKKKLESSERRRVRKRLSVGHMHPPNIRFGDRIRDTCTLTHRVVQWTCLLVERRSLSTITRNKKNNQNQKKKYSQKWRRRKRRLKYRILGGRWRKCVELRGGNCGAETEKKKKKKREELTCFYFFSNDDALYQPVRSGVSYLYTRLFTAYIFVVSFLVLRSDFFSL